MAGPQYHWKCRGRVHCRIVPGPGVPVRHRALFTAVASQHSDQQSVRGDLDGLVWRRPGAIHYWIVGPEIGHCGAASDCLDIVCCHVGGLAVVASGDKTDRVDVVLTAACEKNTFMTTFLLALSKRAEELAWAQRCIQQKNDTVVDLWFYGFLSGATTNSSYAGETWL